MKRKDDTMPQPERILYTPKRPQKKILSEDDPKIIGLA